MTRIKSLFVALFVLLVVVFGAETASSHYRDDCAAQNRREDYLSSLKTCKTAVTMGWPFKSIQSLAYAQTLNELGLAELMLHRYADARRHLADALQMYEHSTPTGSTNQAVTLSNMGLLNMGLGDLRAQKAWYQRSQAMFETLGEPCHDGAARATSNLGLAMNSLGESGAAEVILTQRVESNKNCSQLSGKVRGLTLRALGEAQNKNSNEEDAILSLDSAMTYLVEAKAESSLEMAYTQTTRALVLKDLNRYGEAERSARAAFPILEKIFGSGSVSEGTTRGILAGVLREQGNLRAAEDEYEKTERIYRAQLGRNHPRLATILFQKARLIGSEGRKEQALLLLDEALQIRTFTFGSGSSQVARVNEEIRKIRAD
jgi:tetratricopeptide (TPR) repeat protein